MLSRIAESLFWIGRYVERADGTARIVDGLRLQLLEDPAADEPTACRATLAVMGMPRDEAPTFTEVGEALVFSRNDPSSISGAWHAVRENARRARETLSAELWEAINTTWHGWNGFRRGFLTERHLSWVRERSALVSGIADSTMSHDEAWDFLVLGRSIERADMTARIVATGGIPGGAPWSVVLTSCGAFQAFMRSERGLLTADRAAAFLVLDREFPRSVIYALKQAERRLQELSPPGTERIGMSDEARRQLGRIRTSLEYRVTRDIVADLPAQMRRVQNAVTGASAAIASRYFQAGPMQQWTQDVI